MGAIIKMLLVIVRAQDSQTEVSALVVTVVKIGRDIILSIGQVIENGPVVRFEFLVLRRDHML